MRRRECPSIWFGAERLQENFCWKVGGGGGAGNVSKKKEHDKKVVEE